MKNLRPLTLAAAISAACATPAFADAPSSVAEALKAGDVTLSFRLRYEDVALTNPTADDGDISLLSLKTRLTYTSADFAGWGLGIEMDDTTFINDPDLNPNGNGAPFDNGATILDFEGSEVNQYFLSYKAGKTVAKYGRNRILLDDQRFVGGVGFRQNEQTYDSFLVTSKDVENLTLTGAYITAVKRIFGEMNGAGTHDNKTVLLNANYKISDPIAITGYYYAIDNYSAVGFSTDTFGVRATGKAGDFSYEAELASQSNGGDNETDYTAGFVNLGASYAIKPVTLSIGYQSLGVDTETAADGSTVEKGRFITPLATLHKFQGWADVFLGGGTGNVKGGINDLFFSVGGNAGPVKLAAVYHQFDANDSDVATFDSFGSEIGFLVAGKVAGVGLSFKYADFSADDDATGYKDVQKFWLTAEASF